MSPEAIAAYKDWKATGDLTEDYHLVWELHQTQGIINARYGESV